MKIIVLSKTNYQEKDVIVNAISEDSLLSFKIRGGQSATCPFLWLNNPLTIADIELNENPRYTNKVLKNAKLLFSPLNNGNSMKNLLAISLVAEATNKMFADEDKHLMFNDIESFFVNNKGNDDLYLSEAMFLAKACQKAGSGLEVNQCVNCGSKKDIVAFSFEDGGFLCRNCISEDIACDLSPKQMKVLRYIVNNDFRSLKEDKVDENVDLQDKKALLSRFGAYIDDSIGVNLNSISSILEN